MWVSVRFSLWGLALLEKRRCDVGLSEVFTMGLSSVKEVAM